MSTLNKDIDVFTWNQLKEFHDYNLPMNFEENEYIVKVENNIYFYNVHRAKIHYISSSIALYIHLFNENEQNCGSIAIMPTDKLYVNYKTNYLEIKKPL